MVKRFSAFLYIAICAEIFLSLSKGAGFFCLKEVHAANIKDVVINEIAWMGAKDSSADEWIELYNNTQGTIDLTGWRITAKDGKLEIMLQGTINGGGYFLIERTDDESVPGIGADLITTFGSGLNNGGEILGLYDEAGRLIDFTPLVNEETGWAAGDNTEKFTMERIDPLISGEELTNWQNSKVPSGTPREKNSLVTVLETEEAPDIIEHQDENPTVPDVKPLSEEKKEGLTESEKNSQKETKKSDTTEKELLNEEVKSEEKTSEKKKNLTTVKFLPGKIVISEIYPNPQGIDFESEFIELKNIGGQEINVKNWLIKNNLQEYKISNADFPITLVPSGGFFILPRPITNISLNNNGDIIQVFADNGIKICEAEYKTYALEGASYINSGKEWVWTSKTTPNQDNLYIPLNRAPNAFIDTTGINEIFVGEEISLDASDSFDPDGDRLSYLWNSSDGKEATGVCIKKSFSLSGEYDINLKVADVYNHEDNLKFKVKVLDELWPKPMEDPATRDFPADYQASFGDVIISSIMPNPEGDDSAEWIKLYNNENYPVSLSGWTLDDIEGGSHAFQIPEDVVIMAKDEFIFEREKTGIALNNNGDEVRLFDRDGNLISSVQYDKSDENEEIKFLSEGEGGNEEGEGYNTAALLSAEPSRNANSANWDALDNFLGQKISLEGTISAKPGVLGAQIFYLTNGQKGIEVYSYNKDFPELEAGDYISVSGELAENNSGRRLIIETQDDIKGLSYEHPPLARELSYKDINDSEIHSLVSIKGQLIEKNLPNLFIEMEEGKEIKVYIKESVGISASDFKEGDNISVIGVLDFLNGEYRLLPRDQEDIHVMAQGKVLGVEKEQEIQNESFNESPNEPVRNEEGKGKIITYLSITLFVFVILGIILWKKSL